eukprot:gene3710-691_t
MHVWHNVKADHPPDPRSSHQLSSFGTRVYLFGGECGPVDSHFGYGTPVTPAAVHSLDVAAPTPKWERLECSGLPPSPRLGHGQATVDSNLGSYLYVFGGRQPRVPGVAYDGKEEIRSMNDMHRLDLRTNQWEQVGCTGEVPSPRSYGQLVSAGPVLYFFGGMFDTGDMSPSAPLSAVPPALSLTLLSLPLSFSHCDLYVCDTSAIQDSSGSVWIVGGFCGREVGDVWQFSISSASWVARPDLALPTPRSIFACASAEVAGDSGWGILVFGGEDVPASGNAVAGKYFDEALLLQPDAPEGGARVVTIVPQLDPKADAGASS